MKFLSAALLLFASVCLTAQIGGKVSLIKPTGQLGMALKPTMGLEAMFKSFNEGEHAFSVRLFAGGAMFSPRKDTFPTYGVYDKTVTPGWTVIQNYNLYWIGGGVDYEFVIKNKLLLYPGTDVHVMFSSLSYESYAPLIVSESYSGGYVYIGVQFRFGAEYLLQENIGLFAEATRSMNFSPETGGLAFNNYGIGIHYNF